MMKNLNYDDDSDSSGKRQMEVDKKEKSMMEEKRGKKLYTGEMFKKHWDKSAKRKVSFNSPKSKIVFYDPSSAPMRPIWIRSPDESPITYQATTYDKVDQKKGKQIYKAKSPPSRANMINEMSNKQCGLKIQPKKDFKKPRE